MAGCLSSFSPNSLKPPLNLSFGLVWSTFFRWVQTRIRTGFFGVLRVKCTKRRWFLSSGNVLQFPLRSANCCETVKTRNLVGRGTGARVQIPSPPPVIHRDAFRIGVDFLSLSTLFDSREVLLWIFPSAGHPHPPHRTGVTPAPLAQPPRRARGVLRPGPRKAMPPPYLPGYGTSI